jgi:UDP-glucose:glycoprotein glucosyltransferase
LCWNRNPELYKLDHQYPGKIVKGSPVVILYGEIGAKSLAEFHTTLKKLADSGEIIYVIRHYINERKGPKVRLSGNYWHKHVLGFLKQKSPHFLRIWC